MKKIIILLTLFIAGCSSTATFHKRDPQRGFKSQQREQLKFWNKIWGVADNSPILIRIFKEERVLEVWRKKPNGTYTNIINYDICRYSGKLGPKLKQGDRQAPEGFYTVTHGMMNYYSSQYLSFNTGYPNAFDRSYGRTGSYLMIHGGCSSAGCYAIEDGPMQDLFAAMRDAFKAGQKFIQLQIYPFRMTDSNMSRFTKNKNYDFWKQLKVGYDTFEKTSKPIKVEVKNKRYIIKS